MNRPPRVTLFSYHYLRSRRKAGFHWIADACWRLGWDVVFVTAPISRISRRRGDFRFEYPIETEANELIAVGERLSSYVLYTHYHPFSFRHQWLNRLTSPLVAAYGRTRLGALTEVIRSSNVVMIESTPAVVLLPQLRALCPSARFVYRASDDLTFHNLKTHPRVLSAEEALASDFDLVSAASHITVERLGADRATYHAHGVATHLFDAAVASPYSGGVNVVWVGTRWLDDRFLDLASAAFPEWGFHVIGPVQRVVTRPNIHYYGELAYESTVPFIRHASIGLSTFPPLAAGEWKPESRRIRSLKTMQYTYCGLPIVAPRDLTIGRDHVFYYDLDDPRTVVEALDAAAAAGRSPRLAEDVQSWDDLARTLLGITPEGGRPRLTDI